jgi:2-keto-4-pentenoate hydratase/2-oxohepta-3-ene-1,7-dioic acid hydratase in catechol pathway
MTDKPALRLVTYSRLDDPARQSVGALIGDSTILDLPMAAAASDSGPLPADMVELLQRDDAVTVASALVAAAGSGNVPAGALVDRSACRLWAPVPVPNSIRDAPLFLAHVKAGMAAIGMPTSSAIGTLPAYYKGNRRSVIGTDEALVVPNYADTADFEMEIGVYIRRQGRNIPVDEALSYVGGYTIFNDASARVIQGEEMAIGLGPAKGKDFDTGNGMGPCLVPELDLSRLTYTVRVNGEEWTSGDLSEMHWPLADVISYMSASETLYPGDFIGLGTVPGGCGLELGRYPQPGDVVELEAQPIGVLRVAYAAQPDAKVKLGAARAKASGR